MTFLRSPGNLLCGVGLVLSTNQALTGLAPHKWGDHITLPALGERFTVSPTESCASAW